MNLIVFAQVWYVCRCRIFIFDSALWCTVDFKEVRLVINNLCM
uniref:p5.1 n=1 Tax=Sweet potato chlorotic stunt virus TaxID=81931 RepID=A0A2H4D722_9CLOS|nr:p5.1 [Sweet potato chlorotic stunt virus]